ncbi:sir2 family domain-containing protein [Phthorimaea operculella]|nr:sir2 family domain-containing protein [Phthorimaea operculella]
MSCNYAEGLSPYEHKGVLGIPEKFDPIEKFNEKCELLAQFIAQSKHVVVHTGAGISTSAGIPDFRGPNGVWTLEKEGKKPSINVSFADAEPTKTHMILKKLVECKKVQYIVSQNIDGLHLKSGLPRKYLAELHGNMFIDECNLCKKQFVRHRPVETVGKKCSGVPCASEHVGGRPCRGRLYDGVLDWEHSLPENDLLMAEWHSSIADLSICLGTTLQIIPSGNLPLETAKYGGKLVICNLQPTKHDNKADLVINYYVDEVLERVMNILGLDIPSYNKSESPTVLAANTMLEWSIHRKDVLALEKIYKAKCKGVKKKRNLIKSKRDSANSDLADDKTKVRKVDVKKEKVTNNKNNVTKVKQETTGVKNETASLSNGVTDMKNETPVTNDQPSIEIKDETDTDYDSDIIIMNDEACMGNFNNQANPNVSNTTNSSLSNGVVKFEY